MRSPISPPPARNSSTLRGAAPIGRASSRAVASVHNCNRPASVLDWADGQQRPVIDQNLIAASPY